MVISVCVFSATLKLPESVKWLKLNYRNTGFYIVDYGDDGWSNLTEALSNNISVLTHEDRASLIHNIFALCRYKRQTKQLLHCMQWQKEGKGKNIFQFLYLVVLSFTSCVVNRLERVSFHQVLNFLNYMPSETETAPVTEALLQLKSIYRLLDKRQEQELVARIRVLYMHINS